MELPPVPSVRMLREPLRSAAEQLGRRFDLDQNMRVGVAGSCGDVFVMPRKNRGVDANRVVAVKQQFVQDPSALHDQAFREARILLQLNHLALERKCPNFTFLEEWFKSRPPLLFGATPRGDPSSSVYMYFVLDFAERNLFGQRLEVEQFRSVLFQLLYALSVAQREFQFVHHDLHLKNILLQELPEGVTTLVYHDAGTVWYLPGGPLVKIADFGLARVRVRNGEAEEVIYNVRDSFSELFSRDKDLEKLMDELPKVRPQNAPPEVRDAMKKIRNLMRSSGTLREMLRIPFFDVFTKRPAQGLVAEQCLFASSDGDIAAVQRAATGAEPMVGPREDAIPAALLYELDKVELVAGDGRVATRGTRKEQVEYSVFSAGRGAKRAAPEENALAVILREEAEEEEERKRVTQIVAERRRKEVLEHRLPDLFKDSRVITEPMASAASRVRLGQTQEEARADPLKASFRDAARLAREADAALKLRRKKRSSREEEEREVEVHVVEPRKEQRIGEEEVIEGEGTEPVRASPMPSEIIEL